MILKKTKEIDEYLVIGLYGINSESNANRRETVMMTVVQLIEEE